MHLPTTATRNVTMSNKTMSKRLGMIALEKGRKWLESRKEWMRGRNEKMTQESVL